MSSHDTEPGASPGKPVESPGRLLAVAREAHSLSPADLAVRLRLDTKVVMALERDDYENLPAPTFVKGYIRSIAKELNLDPQAILETYEAHAVIEHPALADFSSRAPDQVGVNSTIIKAITYGLAVVLILLIVLWWRSNYQNNETNNSAAAEIETADFRAEPLSYTYTVVEHEQSGWRVNPPETPTAGNGVDPIEISANEGSADAEPSATHRLYISTTNEAWVEVYDASGDKLYFGLTKVDDPVELDGEVYYRLILGNTGSVTLRYDGDEIDLGPHAEEGVAQLELGSAPNDDDQVR